jgi:hypothetical protein
VVIFVCDPHHEGSVKIAIGSPWRTRMFSTIAGRSSRKSSPSSVLA